MKRKTFFYAMLLMLFVSFMASPLSTYGEVISATSDSFVFGSPPIAVPLSLLAFIIPAGLILLVSVRRYLRLSRKASL
jgi:hypothetical protein